MPVIPATDVGQTQNGGSVCSLIQIWDGRGALLETNNYTLEFAWFWMLNAWDSRYGNIYVYTGQPLDTHFTELTLTPDTEWHSFEMIVNFQTQKWVSLTIDNQTADLSTVDLGKVDHTNWSTDTRVALLITTESLPTWPGSDCSTVFSWTTQYKDAVFSVLQ